MSEKLEKEEYLHTAICTWSGYVYQGKVALLHALQLIINEDLQLAKGFQLQLDYLDDFAILDMSGSTKSIHQVKAYSLTYFSAYEKAIDKQQASANTIGCSDAYLHVANKIHDKTAQSIESEHSPVKLYNYSMTETEIHNCSLHDIDDQIQIRIKSFATKYKHDQSFRQTEAYLEKCSCILNHIVQEQVIAIHSAVHLGAAQGEAASKQTIPFDRFIAILVLRP